MRTEHDKKTKVILADVHTHLISPYHACTPLYARLNGRLIWVYSIL